ncbi:uncharacterized protein NDAI_0A01820 [Naumovozyma dairenensis CBS 421]|uniref:Uncharacterized protein n=1 Tax=Naumovozyma dairenensis (strain ATCC 10597 / BCRC 20456 / CBS 421 / NBRC 0211 / NRRL Y-12639) TaxID=1071378 RepID=G0W3F2_NAUDC|nr:hypothetical protein NDAI_0A01820 [Naumovozyma dairenensis CBS 421]CCD22340.1 hypothetical protein NDAI_0A01820 [Naumovozyma dairenensis CBS 421]
MKTRNFNPNNKRRQPKPEVLTPNQDKDNRQASLKQLFTEKPLISMLLAPSGSSDALRFKSTQFNALDQLRFKSNFAINAQTNTCSSVLKDLYLDPTNNLRMSILRKYIMEKVKQEKDEKNTKTNENTPLISKESKQGIQKIKSGKQPQKRQRRQEQQSDMNSNMLRPIDLNPLNNTCSTMNVKTDKLRSNRYSYLSSASTKCNDNDDDIYEYDYDDLYDIEVVKEHRNSTVLKLENLEDELLKVKEQTDYIIRLLDMDPILQSNNIIMEKLDNLEHKQDEYERKFIESQFKIVQNSIESCEELLSKFQFEDDEEYYYDCESISSLNVNSAKTKHRINRISSQDLDKLIETDSDELSDVNSAGVEKVVSNEELATVKNETQVEKEIDSIDSIVHDVERTKSTKNGIQLPSTSITPNPRRNSNINNFPVTINNNKNNNNSYSYSNSNIHIENGNDNSHKNGFNLNIQIVF